MPVFVREATSGEDDEALVRSESAAFLIEDTRVVLPDDAFGAPRRGGRVLVWLTSSVLVMFVIVALATSFPQKRGHTRGFQRLWGSGATCRNMGCSTENYVGTCQCNDGCIYFDDCCPDYQDVCMPQSHEDDSATTATCANLGCGSDSLGCRGVANCANLCDCVPSCRETGSCCSDYEALCLGQGAYHGDGGGGWDSNEGGHWNNQYGSENGHDGEGFDGEDGAGERYGVGGAPADEQARETSTTTVATSNVETTTATTTTTTTIRTVDAAKLQEEVRREERRKKRWEEQRRQQEEREAELQKEAQEKQRQEEREEAREEAREESREEAREERREENGEDEDLSQSEQKARVRHQAFVKKHDALLELLKWQQVRACPAQLYNRDIAEGSDAGTFPNVLSAAECQRLCTEKQCDASVWGAIRGVRGLSDTCFLKKLDATPKMFHRDGVVASLPCCRMHEEGQSCPSPVFQTDVQTSEAFAPLGGSQSAEDCQQQCTNTKGCAAWAWGAAKNKPGLTDVCFLKKLAPDETPQLVDNADVMSGLPCGCKSPANHALWPREEVEVFSMPKPPAPRPSTPGSMLCLALMIAYSYETELLTQQYAHKRGIFACDAFGVYSNQLIVLAKGLVTKVIRSTQMCEVGGEFKTALNLRIFAAFWKQVFVDGEFLNHNFVVKADPDTVFIHHRLPPLLAKYDDRASGLDGKGVYFNNCKYGMHGPLEVFSQNAMLALWGLFEPCYHYFRKLCSGDCHWGEDLWCDQCLKRKANATIDRVNLYDLLLEQHCDPPDDWDSCTDKDSVAFHPFKSSDTWAECYDNIF
mmetsp:Transcript_2283/g.5387  ORF Transcript_2283/g.5387 Transcript_2283/m.5387 type:complete len:813 (+) Transcript_2283:40-2478(+)